MGRERIENGECGCEQKPKTWQQKTWVDGRWRRDVGVRTHE